MYVQFPFSLLDITFVEVLDFSLKWLIIGVNFHTQLSIAWVFTEPTGYLIKRSFLLLPQITTTAALDF